MKFAALLLIGLIAAIDAAPQKRSGAVRAEGRAVADAAGPFNALGATMFWGAWAYKSDRPRLDRNLNVLSATGIDYVRVLGSVGGASWEDRQTDPRWPDYDAIIAGMTDLAYDTYGMRVQWTLFGGAPFTATAADREALVDRFAAMAKGREHKIFAFEIANEAWQNGFAGPEGLSELRRLGKRLSDKTAVLVALSSPRAGAACATYAGAGVDAMTLHYERGFGERPRPERGAKPPSESERGWGPASSENDGPLKPVLRPWSFPAAYDRACRGQLPALVFNNEPIGPESSVRQDDSPSRIAAGYVMTFLAGNASYVLHSGPGIRGGGAADVNSKLRRHAHFDELPSFKAIAAALGAAKQYLPAGLANWTRHNPNARAAPMYGFDRLYSASKASDFIALALPAPTPVTLQSRVNASIDVRQITTGKLLTRLDISSGKDFTLTIDEPVVLLKCCNHQ